MTVTNVGTAGAAGTGIAFTPALIRAHIVGAHVATTTAPQVGHTGDIGGVPLVQPPPPGSAPGSVCGRVVVPVQSQRRQLVDVERLRRALVARDADPPEHDGDAHRGAGHPHLAAADVGDGRRGRIYLVWQTRSFRVGSVASTPNDIAMSVMPAPTARNRTRSFGAPARIPIEADNTTANTNDHFIPGIAADPSTSGATAHLGLFYYNYPVAACVYVDPANPANQCNLRVGYVSSIDGGATWSAPQYLASMSLPDSCGRARG